MPQLHALTPSLPPRDAFSALGHGLGVRTADATGW